MLPATVFGVLSLNNDAEESFQLDLELSSMGLNSESSSECFYVLLLCLLALFASISPPFFYDCLSAAASQLGYDAHPEFTLSTTKEVGGK